MDKQDRVPSITPILADALASQIEVLPLVGTEPFETFIKRVDGGLVIEFSAEDEHGAFASFDGTSWTLDPEIDPGPAVKHSPSEPTTFPSILSPRQFRPHDDAAESFADVAAGEIDDYYSAVYEMHQPLLGLFQVLVATGWRVKVCYSPNLETVSAATIQLRAYPPADTDLHNKTIQRALGPVPSFSILAIEWTEETPDKWGFVGANTGFVAKDGVHPRRIHMLADYAIAVAPTWTLAPGIDQSLRSLDAPTRPAVQLAPPEPLPLEAIGSRRDKIAEWADANGFRDEIRPATPRTVKAYLDAAGDGTAGYYLLEFDNGECYVGQSVSIDRRLSQHLLTHPDTASIRAKTDPAAVSAENTLRHLLREERKLIHSAQRAELYARNKSEMTVVVGSAKLDHIISREEQAEWLANPRRANTPDLELGRQISLTTSAFAGSGANFANLNKVAGEDASLMHRLIRQYLVNCIAHPHSTEGHFWNISAPLRAGRGGPPARWRTLCCLTVGMVETLVILKEVRTGQIEGFMQVNGSELFGDLDPDAAYLQLKRQHPGADIHPADYRDSGPDNWNLSFPNLSVLVRLLADTHITRSAATATLLLMRVRRAPGTRQITHCPELVTAAWASS